MDHGSGRLSLFAFPELNGRRCRCVVRTYGNIRIRSIQTIWQNKIYGRTSTGLCVRKYKIFYLFCFCIRWCDHDMSAIAGILNVHFQIQLFSIFANSLYLKLFLFFRIHGTDLYL